MLILDKFYENVYLTNGITGVMKILKKLSFKMKLLITILPVVIIGMSILSFTTFYEFRKNIENELINNKLKEGKN